MMTVSQEIDDPLNVTCSTNLAEEDYVRAGLRPRSRKKLPACKPFDREEVVQRILEHRSDKNWNHPDFNLDHAMSREEAFLWLSALNETENKIDEDNPALKYINRVSQVFPQGAQSRAMSRALGNMSLKLASMYGGSEPAIDNTLLAERLVNIDVSEALDIEPLLKTLTHSTPKITAYLLYRVVSPSDLGRCLSAWLRNAHRFAMDNPDYIRINVLPYASDEEVAEMRAAVLAELPAVTVSKRAVYKLLVHLGEKDAVAKWVLSFQPGSHDVRGSVSDIVSVLLSLGDPVFVSEQMKRLNLDLRNVTEARTWLALTQDAGLGLLLSSVNPNGGDEEGMIGAVARVVSPAVAPHLLKWQSDGKALATCKQWFEANPKHTAAGLKNVVSGSDPKLAGLAARVLNGLVKRGHGDIVRAHLETLSPEVFGRIGPEIFLVPEEEAKYEPLSPAETPDALKVTPGPDSQTKPGDLLPNELPPLTVDIGGELRRIGDSQFFTLLHALAKSKPGAPKPYVTSVRSLATPQSRDAFAWALLQNWLDGYGSAKEKWKFIAMGHIGGDACALKLMPLIREWPGEGHYTWALTALKCLEDIGTDTALMQLTSIAQKSAYKGRQEEARKALEAIAVKRGYTKAELEDRIVPDCGLDEKGSRWFDTGSRQFALSLSPELKPVLRETKEGGFLPKILTDLPAPSQKDDPVKSEKAIAEWKTLKKQVTAAAKVQASRLEEAMISSRRWSPNDFENLLVRHPLMTNLIRRLVCGVYDQENRLLQTFRVTEDSTFADSQDQVYNIPEFTKIGIAHPLQMDPQERGVWGEILSDYEILPPFPQLGRPIFALTDDELQSRKIERYNPIEIPCALLVFTLDKRNWAREKPKDSGWFTEHSKAFDGSGITGAIAYDPGTWGGSQGDPQHVTEVYFYKTGSVEGSIEMLPLKDVDKIIVSEVLMDLNLIASKVK